MNTRIARYARLSIEVALVVVAGYWLFTTLYSHRSAAADKATATCVNGPDVQCPTADFLKQVEQFDSLQAQINKLRQSPQMAEFQNKSDQLVGMSERLRGMIPSGYVWDDSNKRFDRAAPPPTPTAAKPAEPATKPPSGKKPKS